MADRDPRSAEEIHQLSHQQGEDKGRIKRTQQTTANMPEKALPRRSEPETPGSTSSRR